LTRVRGLRVLAWNSASKLKGREDDILGAARVLGADSVVVGSVRRDGGRVRIAARLLQTASGLYLWSESYDRDLVDLFSIQEGIARAIARTLAGTLAARPREPLSAAKVAAYDLYLRGRYVGNRRTMEGLQQSVACFEQALQVDEGFALAHSGLADAYCLLTEYGLLAPGQALPLARAAALRALELDPRSAEAHASHALIRSLHDWEWHEAEALYRRAIELNPGYATAHHWLAIDLLAILGRFEEAHEEIEVARQLDPLSLIIHEGRPYLWMLEGRYGEALEGYRRVAELDPDFAKALTGMGRTYAQMGRHAEAIEMLRRGREVAGNLPSILGALGQTFALAGDVDAARGVLAELRALAATKYVPSTSFALVHAGLGENERALDWLERAAGLRELSLTVIKSHPAYDSLRQEPRFAALLTRLRFD
jgi:tetratricopeptide (TPR) repeat protein